MITLEDSAKVCKDIFLRGVEVPQTPVQKFLTRNGEAIAPPMRNGPGYWNGSNGTNGTTNGTNGAKAKAVSAPRSEQKRSWLRICQQVWRVPGAQSVNIAQMTEAGTMVGQIMTALSKEVGAQRCQLVDCLIPIILWRDIIPVNPSIIYVVMLYIYTHIYWDISNYYIPLYPTISHWLMNRGVLPEMCPWLNGLIFCLKRPWNSMVNHH